MWFRKKFVSLLDHPSKTPNDLILAPRIVQPIPPINHLSIIILCSGGWQYFVIQKAKSKSRHYLWHTSVCPRSLLVLVEYIGVVIRRKQLIELGIVLNDSSLRGPAGSQGILRHVGDPLVKLQRGGLPRTLWLLTRSPRTCLGGPQQETRQEEDNRKQEHVTSHGACFSQFFRWSRCVIWWSNIKIIWCVMTCGILRNLSVAWRHISVLGGGEQCHYHLIVRQVYYLWRG